ncbi:MAG: amidohydrolase family protein [Alphaproteobacteria bacterium]|nr:amidohydrolase family protein [Alphaproteobacteria bacterium]
MKNSIGALLAAIVLAAAGCSAPPEIVERGTVVENVTLISPVAPHETAGAYVLIQDGVIARISYDKAIKAAETIDGSGKYLTPGLIDSHVHLRGDAGLRADHAEAHPELVAAFYDQEPYSYLYFGFTTLVDLAQSEETASQWRASEDYPDLIYCKRLNLANGYGMAFTSEDQKFSSPYFIYDEGQEDEIPSATDLKQHTPVAVIQKVLQTNASCVKTFHESGFGGLFDWPTPSDKLTGEIQQLAAENGLVHVMHGNTTAAWRQAAVAKLDVIAHGLWHWEEFNSEEELPEGIIFILERIMENGVGVQLTSQVIEGEIRAFDSAFLDTELLAHSLPQKLIDWHKSEDGAWFRALMKKRLDSNPDIVEAFLGHAPTGGDTETSETAMRRIGQVAEYINKHGGLLLLASDSPSSPTFSNPPGLNGYLEMRAMARFGLTPLEVLQAATINNARAFKIADQVGVIEEGKRANLLLLDQNPLEDIAAYESIRLVIKGGKVFQREELSAMNRQGATMQSAN